ncbi:MAG TPA: SulP family inorganic anion transporter [Vicinamibacterales bacterium]|nr:SulP family inorganic anion transporter [Vicinamibacterales bacterium]
MTRLYKFDWSNTRGDLFGGVTAAVVALPLALAFGVQSGLGAAAGIYGAMAIGFFASYLGGTPAQVSGPTGPMTVVSAAVAASVAAAAAGTGHEFAAITATFLLAGVLQIGLGLMRVGKYIRYVPYPVISGFMTGIGAIIILLQIFPMLGQRSPSAVLDVVLTIGTALSAINWAALVLAVLTYALIVVTPMVTKAVPSTLVALLSMTAVSIALGWDVPRIGEIPQGLPTLRLDGLFGIDAHLWSSIISDGVALAALGAIDSLLTSLVADSLTRTRHDSEQELIGQGVGNMVAAAIGGIPGAGATMRTVVNIRAGGRTRLSGMVHGLVLLAVLLGLGRYAAFVPLSVLAGILISVGVGIMDVRGLRQLRHVPRADAVVLAMVLVVTVFFDLIQAVALGVALSSMLFMKRMGDEGALRSKVAAFDEFIGEPAHPEEAALFGRLAPMVMVKHLHGPLHFGFTSSLQDMAARLRFTPYVVIRMVDVPFVDQSGLNALMELVVDLEARGSAVFITELQEQPRQVLAGAAPGLLPAARVLAEFPDVLTHISAVPARERAAA